ncbi:hypothetical protein [Nocardioides sp. R-C-SC26]|uniref:hypothetical protein n=1 Tax=Nocardioides sp. R-C-SC26 TaxID=2870414 RepID=UPI001E2D8C9C|nr:hypothetical protein [Nocardioides sp. R-C-SC26]
MKFGRTLVLLLALLVVWAVGPWALLVLLGLLAAPRVRRWLRPSRRTVGVGAATVAVVVAVIVVIPDGRLPIPPGIGALVTPSYRGSPATADPLDVVVPQHPGMARNGASAMHNDGWSSDAYTWEGPLGRQPEVNTAWYGIKECATLAFDTKNRMVALCGNMRGAIMHVLDPESMVPQATLVLPARGDGRGKKPWENLCGGSYFYLDDLDRAVVATTERRIVTITTSDADGEPALSIESSIDLTDYIPGDDCLIALMPDWKGQGTWWVTEDGRVGIASAGRVAMLDLDEEIANSVSVGQDGGLYVVTVEQFYKLVLRDGEVVPAWETPYDRGSQKKTGQLSQGSGTTPTLMPNGMVAITDNADPRMNVQFYRQRTGELVCQEPVFDDDASASDNSLVLVDDNGVVVENNVGYSDPLRTVLGRSTHGGFARVDVDPEAGTCRTVWTNDVVGPSSVAKVSLATGLVYAYTKRSNWWGVNAWYLSAMSARTGKLEFEVRTGIGTMFNNHYSAVTLGPDGSAYAATLTGMVRVHDRDAR